MADTAKPAAKRKPARRGPTKAAALKALGLTQEDLDAIKAFKLAQLEEVEQDEPVEEEFSGSGHYIPPTGWTPEPQQQEAPQQFYVRNCRGVEVGLRLESQEGQGKKRFDLKPRGERGDIKPLKTSDLEDPALISNVELGVVEIITAAEAKGAIQKQSVNEQARVHPAMAMLRSELGNPYTEEQIILPQDHVDESVVVAELNPVGGEFGEIQFTKGQKGTFQRTTPQESGRQLGGNPAIVSDGFAAARAADEVARQKNIEGPAAGLGGIQTVVVETPKEVKVKKPKGA